MGILGTLGSLNVLLSADTATFNTAMEKAAFVADKNFQKITRSNQTAMVAITAAMAAGATAISVAVKKSIDHADEIGKMAQSIGLTAEQLSGLEYAAKLSNIEIDGLRTSFQKFNKAIYEAAQGSKAQVEAFKAVGISQDELFDASGNLKSTNALFFESSEGLSKMANNAQKTGVALDLFGKSGAAMIHLLNGGKEGIKALTDEAQKLGVVISGETAVSAEIFNDNMTRLASAMQGIINSFTQGVLPTLVSFSETISNSSLALENFKIAGEAVGKTLLVLGNAISSTVGWYRILYHAQKLEFGKIAELYEQMKKDDKKMWDTITGNGQAGAAKVTDNYKKFTDAVETFNALEKEGEALKISLMTAQEKYNKEIEHFSELRKANAIDEETYRRAVAKSNDELIKANNKTKELVTWAKNVGDAFSNAFESAIMDGKRFSDVLKGLLDDILRIAVRTAITEPLGQAIGSGLSSMFGGGNPKVPMSPGQVEAFVASSKGNVFTNGTYTPFASGGLVTRPTLFPMANGGTALAGEAGTEAIMPLFRDKNGKLGVSSGGMGGANVQVNVYAPSGSKVSQSRESNGDMEKINIMIDEATASSISNAGSKTHRALKNSFGLRQSLTTR